MRPEYYKEYYQLERSNWWFLARKQILSDQVRKFSGGRHGLKILNVGAALGASTLMLQEFGDVISLEYDKYCCDFVKKELGLIFINGSITELPFGEDQFDIVCAFDVVEHVQEDLLAVTELHRVCKSDGFVFTTVPAFKFLWSEHDEINEHVRRYTLKSYSQLFTTVGASVYFKTYFNFWLFLPIAIVRIITSVLFKKKEDEKVKSDFNKVQAGFISRCLFQIFRSETSLLKKGIKFPFGISLMIISNKA